MTNDKDSAVLDSAMLEALQKDADIPHLPTQETYQFRMAVSGQGPLAYQWSDKPHRLLYDACSIIESQAAMRQPTQSDAMLEGDTQTILYLLGVRHGREDERAKIAAEASQPTQSDVLREAEILEAAIDRMGWVEINAYRAELRKGQGAFEDAGGFMIRAVKALFGIKPIDPVVNYQSAARALVTAALQEQSK